MKKYLKLSVMCVLISAMAVVFGSCKDEDHGVTDPLLDFTIDLPEGDGSVAPQIVIDQMKKEVVVSLSRQVDLSSVNCTFKLVPGASLYTPFLSNPVKLNLSDSTGVVIKTGDRFVYYKIKSVVDYALKSFTASAGGVKGEVSIDQRNQIVEVYFAQAGLDLTKVDVNMVISDATTMVNPTETSTIMDLSADTTYIKMTNAFSGELTYKVVVWNDLQGDPVLRVGGSDVGIEKDLVSGDYTLTVTGSSPTFWTQTFQRGYAGHIFSFDYQLAADVKKPKVSLDLNKKATTAIAYDLKASEENEWSTYKIDVKTLFDGADKTLPGYRVNFALTGAQVGTVIKLRNVKVRERTVDEKQKYANAFFWVYKQQGAGQGGNNNMSCSLATENPDYPIYKFHVTENSDPYAFASGNSRTIKPEDNQLYFEYKSPSTKFSGEIYFKAIGGYALGLGQTFDIAEDYWVFVHIDWTDPLAKHLAAHPDAGDSGAESRFDLDGLASGNVDVFIRNIRLEQK